MRRTSVLIFGAFILLLAACGPAEPKSFSCNPEGGAADSYTKPEQVIRSGYDYEATILMENGGQIVIDLFPESAPITVNNFVFLACEGYYDGVTFHRVIPGFMAQGGDPTGTGGGGPGYTIQHEADNGLPFDRPWLFSMAHRNAPNTTGSQFFITYSPQPGLDPDFTVFGELIEGQDIVAGLTPRNPAENPDAPPGDRISTIRVVEK
nr:peptidylprolyl isomerase [Anaerolineae bacterium]